VESQQVMSIAVAIVAAAIGGGVVYLAWKGRSVRLEKMASRELAVIVEEIHATATGTICTVLLILMLAIVAVLYFLAFSTALLLGSIVSTGIGIMSIGVFLLLGLGVALGRRRTYRVYRSEHREPM